jgi:CheY-like chemotaxis protein
MDPPPANSAILQYHDGMKHVLLCDDEPHIVRLLKINLEHAGFQVTTATNGREAKESLERTEYDLAILDYVMPFADGVEVAEYMRNVLGRNTPIVITTQASIEEVQERIGPLPRVCVGRQTTDIDWTALMSA